MAKQQPIVTEGIEYWSKQPADYNGVLGGFGNGSLPRVDSLGSRQFLQYLLPELCTVPCAAFPRPAPSSNQRRIRAVDVGAGVGRVTSDVLLHLVSDIILLEPVGTFIQEAWRRGSASESENPIRNPSFARWKGIQSKQKSVTFLQGTLQDFDPSHPQRATKRIGRAGYHPDEDDLESGFDVIWCQWCLGHLNELDLVAFFRRCRAALREPDKSLIVVKENLCTDTNDQPTVVFDDDDSSLTRSDLAWKRAFKEAGLTILYEKVQGGFPAGLYEVKMYALR